MHDKVTLCKLISRQTILEVRKLTVLDRENALRLWIEAHLTILLIFYKGLDDLAKNESANEPTESFF